MLSFKTVHTTVHFCCAWQKPPLTENAIKAHGIHIHKMEVRNA